MRAYSPLARDGRDIYVGVGALIPSDSLLRSVTRWVHGACPSVLPTCNGFAPSPSGLLSSQTFPAGVFGFIESGRLRG